MSTGGTLDLEHADDRGSIPLMPVWPDGYGLTENLTEPEDLHWSVLTDVSLNFHESLLTAPNAHDELLDESSLIDPSAEIWSTDFSVDYPSLLAAPSPSEYILGEGAHDDAESYDHARESEAYLWGRIDGSMSVKEQPKADQRARYASDGPRFLPDSRKHPMSVQLPHLPPVLGSTDKTLGIVLTMATSTCNPQKRAFVHVNGLKYRSEDAVELDNGSVFLPLTPSDVETREKSFPRLSIICKKYDDYTFDLIPIDAASSNETPGKYEGGNVTHSGNTAKGKRFTVDYDLLSYKIVFRLAVKQQSRISVLPIQCETNLVHEEKSATKGVKRKASPSTNTFSKKKNSTKLPVTRSSVKPRMPQI